MRVVMLTEQEVATAVYVGTRRQMYAEKAGHKDADGMRADARWGAHIEGAKAEAAVAKFFGAWWSGEVGNIYSKDVGRIQVRSTLWATGRLKVRERDPDEDPFVLVINDSPHFRLVGWIYGRDAKREEWSDAPDKGRPPAFFVPQGALKDIDTVTREMAQWTTTASR